MSLVSIIIPSWNRVDLLTCVLKTVGEQTYARREVIVVDNGSSDGSSTAATAAGAEFSGLRRIGASLKLSTSGFGPQPATGFSS